MLLMEWNETLEITIRLGKMETFDDLEKNGFSGRVRWKPDWIEFMKN